MKALVLVGGFGTRLRPVTYTVPKQLIPIAGKAMMYHVFDLLPPEVDEVVLATGYKSEVIADYVARHPIRVPIRCVPEREPLGTGGGMRNAGDGMSDPFLLLNSDVIADVSLPQMIVAHRQHGGIGTMALAEVEDTKPFGVAALDGDDRISHFVEKPEPKDAPSHWINAGLAIWSSSVLTRIAPGVPSSFEQTYVPQLLAEGLYGFRFQGFWDDAGTPARLLNAQKFLFDAGRGGKGGLPPGALGSGPVAVGARVSARGASFGKYVTLDDDVQVAAGAHVENSVLMSGAIVEKEATVLGSVIGPGARVAAGHRASGVVLGEKGEA